MSVVRLLLHVAAAVVPTLVIVLAIGFSGGGAAEIVPFAAVAVLAAQCVALAGWPLLDSAARRPGRARAVFAGLFMALLTHGLFAVLLSVLLFLDQQALRDPARLLGGTVFFMFASLLLAGWVTLPLLMGLGVLLQNLRRDELALPQPQAAA